MSSSCLETSLYAIHYSAFVNLLLFIATLHVTEVHGAFESTCQPLLDPLIKTWVSKTWPVSKTFYTRVASLCFQLVSIALKKKINLKYNPLIFTWFPSVLWIARVFVFLKHFSFSIGLFCFMCFVVDLCGRERAGGSLVSPGHSTVPEQMKPELTELSGAQTDGNGALLVV